MDRFTAAGLAATWWEASFHELETAASRGWKGVIDAWLTTAEAAADDKHAPDLADQPAVRLLAGPELANRTDLAAEAARIDAEIKAAEASDAEEDEPGDDALGPAEIKKLKSERTRAKRALKAIDASLLAAARQTLDTMKEADASTEAVGVLRSRIESLVAITLPRSSAAPSPGTTTSSTSTPPPSETLKPNGTQPPPASTSTSRSWGMRRVYSVTWWIRSRRRQSDGSQRTCLTLVLSMLSPVLGRWVVPLRLRSP